MTNERTQMARFSLRTTDGGHRRLERLHGGLRDAQAPRQKNRRVRGGPRVALALRRRGGFRSGLGERIPSDIVRYHADSAPGALTPPCRVRGPSRRLDGMGDFGPSRPEEKGYEKETHERCVEGMKKTVVVCARRYREKHFLLVHLRASLRPGPRRRHLPHTRGPTGVAQTFVSDVVTHEVLPGDERGGVQARRALEKCSRVHFASS